MQYYLSGTVSEYKKIAPSKSLIACAHELASDYGVKNIILGGGVGSSRDALFKFKEGFSKTTKPFFIIKKILNNEVYQQLCMMNKINPEATSFFPAYRA